MRSRLTACLRPRYFRREYGGSSSWLKRINNGARKTLVMLAKIGLGRINPNVDVARLAGSYVLEYSNIAFSMGAHRRISSRSFDMELYLDLFLPHFFTDKEIFSLLGSLGFDSHSVGLFLDGEVLKLSAGVRIELRRSGTSISKKEARSIQKERIRISFEREFLRGDGIDRRFLSGGGIDAECVKKVAREDIESLKSVRRRLTGLIKRRYDSVIHVDFKSKKRISPTSHLERQSSRHCPQ